MAIIRTTHIGIDYATVEITDGRGTATEYEVQIAVAKAIEETIKAAFDTAWEASGEGFNGEYNKLGLPGNQTYSKFRSNKLRLL